MILKVEGEGKTGGQRDGTPERLDFPWLALMVVEGGLEPRNVGGLESWKGERVVSPLEPPGSNAALLTPVCSLETHVRHLTFRNIMSVSWRKP